MVYSQDVDREEVVFQHAIQPLPLAPRMRRVILTDISFSPDGHHVSVSDSTGSITLFGLGDPGPFNVGANYPEQHFSTDYTEFFVDAEGVAVDVGTQLPVHEAPVGVLCSQFRFRTKISLVNPDITQSPCHATSLWRHRSATTSLIRVWVAQ